MQELNFSFLFPGHAGCVPAIYFNIFIRLQGLTKYKMKSWFYLRVADGGWRRLLSAILLLVAGGFYSLYFLHLQADFPNHSPWMDWAKYTDEGWYGNAAIEEYVRGHWHVDGDFNPAVALPVWPVIEGIVFKFTGVSLSVARALTVAVFGTILAMVWLLLRRYYQALTAGLAVLLLAVSPFCYVFTRMAILEPMMVLLMLMALLVASYAKPGRLWPVLALGILLPLMVLTKTTAIFLFPAVFFLLLARLHGRIWVFIRQAMSVTAIAAALWGSYFALLVRPHYLQDYQYLFSANNYTGISMENCWEVLVSTLQSGMWMDVVLYPAFGVMLLALLVGAVRNRISWLRHNPLVVTLLLWMAGYFGFLAYHDNIQPRYYLVIMIPMITVLAIGMEASVKWLLAVTLRLNFLRLGMAVVCATVLVTAIGSDARLMLHFVRTPQYTFLNAAREVQQIIDHDPGDGKHGRNRILMSISGNNITLMTGLPSICDDFGTMELDDRIAAYKPGWYVTWNMVEDDKQEALDKYYRLERVAEIPAMDDPDRNLLILYKLLPRDGDRSMSIGRPHRQVQMLRTGLDFTRPERLGPERAGQEKTGAGRMGMDFSGVSTDVAKSSILDMQPATVQAADTGGSIVLTKKN